VSFLNDLEVEFCSVCCSQHGTLRPCPGLVETTSEERPGRRFVAERDTGTEHYEVLVAEAGELWQARIRTVPDRFWGVPDGNRTAKFYEASEAEAERKAVLHIFKRCKAQEIQVRELTGSQRLAVDDSSAGNRRFGTERPQWPAQVYNISKEGLFLATARPEEVGERVRILMQIDQFTVPLVGRVAWVREIREGDLSPGMGVELDEPPFVYRARVAQLTAFEDPDED
jgi:hypothetical protein